MMQALTIQGLIQCLSRNLTYCSEELSLKAREFVLVQVVFTRSDFYLLM